MPQWSSVCEDATLDPKARSQADAFFRSLLDDRDNSILRYSRQSLTIQTIQRRHFLWGVSQVLWEHRSLAEATWPTADPPTGGSPRSAGDFSPWEEEMPPAPEDFREDQRERVLPASRSVTRCPECGGERQVDCYHCHGSRTESCSTCNGGGTVSCGSCRGSGILTCGKCGGEGEIIAFSRVYTDENGLTQTEHTFDTCPSCGGSGRLVCRSCRGSGMVTCHTCNGSGLVTCGACGGSGIVSCATCEGQGQLLHGVVLSQSFHTRMTALPLTHFSDLTRRYAELDIPTDALREPILSATAESAMIPPSLEEILPQKDLELTGAPTALETLLSDNREGLDHLTRQGLAIYAKELLEVTYSIQGREYHVLLDPDSGLTHLDVHPFHHILQDQVQALGRLREERNYRELSALSRAFLALAQDSDDFASYAKECKDILKQVDKTFLLWQILGVAAGWLLGALVNMLVTRSLSLSPVLLLAPTFSLPLAFVLRRLWGRLPLEGEQPLRIAGVVLGALLGAASTALVLAAAARL